MKKLFVISLGGSLIVPKDIDAKFLRQFRSLILRHVKRGHRFIIITGGGYTTRWYQRALREVTRVSDLQLDWMGIAPTRLHAEFVRLMFGKLAHPNVIIEPNRRVNFREKIMTAGGWIPGRSTDDDAVRLAKTYGSKTIINLSNIDYVYTKDPRRHRDAKKIEQMSWREYLKVVGTKWDPGANFPFDPVAAKFAQKYGLSAIIANGKNLKNLEQVLSGKKFRGTILT